MVYYASVGSIVTVAVALPLLDTLAVILRFLARKKQRVLLQADDWLALAALVIQTSSCA